MKPILADLGLVTTGDERAWAITSPDDSCRYVLGRTWDAYFPPSGREWWDCVPARPLWCFCMLNPSKARHDKDDPTIRKCTGFAKRGGAGGFIVVNLFAYSATDPSEMVAAARNGVDVRGEHNEAVLHWAQGRPALLGRSVAAWGKIPPRLRALSQRSRGSFLLTRGVECFGVNLDNSPKHPLMLGYDTPIVKLADAQHPF